MRAGVILAVAAAASLLAAAGGKDEKKADPPPAPAAKGAVTAPAPGLPHAAPKETRCEACHTPKAWFPARFAHERTDFPLLGRHNGVACGDCHGSDYERPIPTSCAGCHEDPHAQEFGLMCRSCHSEDSFAAPNFLVDSHRRTSFPLTGRHAVLPCDECHVEKRERTFTRAALDCAACHARDAARASLVTVDHTQPPFAGGSCRGCHEPVSFTPARLAPHDACFPISRGVHAPVSCSECHAGLRGARLSGSCSGVPVRCAECHEHRAEVEDRHHDDVDGYEHKSAKCAACHRTGT